MLDSTSILTTCKLQNHFLDNGANNILHFGLNKDGPGMESLAMPFYLFQPIQECSTNICEVSVNKF